MDLNSLKLAAAAETGTIVELLHPGTRELLKDEAGKPYFIELRGFDGSSVRDIDKRIQNKRQESIRKGQAPKTDIDTLETESVMRLNAATIRWHLPPLDGVTLDYTHENGKRIYGDPEYAWIAEQAIEAGRDRSRFFEKDSIS